MSQRAWARLAAAVALVAACVALGAGCHIIFGLDDKAIAAGSGGAGASSGSGGSGGAGGSSSGSGGDGGVPGLVVADKVDLLLVLDNSRLMLDKHAVLGATLADLLQSLNQLGLRDLHIGVISSSLGGHGADTCDSSTSPTTNDQAHLLDRDAAEGGGTVPTYEDQGFLVWDPDGTHEPAGETAIGLVLQNLEAMVGGVGALGCGYEAPLEAWYRFLIDPDPYASITIEPATGNALLNGTDQQVLAQRAEFLRPDSLLVILVLSDENDCSIRDGGQYYLVAQTYQPNTANPFHLPKPRAACAIDPADPCCKSCSEPPGSGCSTGQDDCSGPLSHLDDSINLRCFDQKRRFGIDFLWPIERYVTGLRSAEVADRHGNILPNPLFFNPAAPGENTRSSDLVLFAPIVGVPWRLIARRDGNNQPDLIAGLNAEDEPVGGFLSADEIGAIDLWPQLIGDPDSYSPPLSPHMVESVDARAGLSQQATNWDDNHGHDFDIPDRDDLQYACVYRRAEPTNCMNAEVECECSAPPNEKPVCWNGSQYTSNQCYGRAVPGIRHLHLARELGGNAVIGSVCPAQVTSPTLDDFAYVPAVKSLLEAVEPRLDPEP